MTTSTFVIDGPGNYRARNGKRVVISNHDRKTTGSFPCEGHIILKEKPLRQEWTVWQRDGRWRIFGESPVDIVSKDPA